MCLLFIVIGCRDSYGELGANYLAKAASKTLALILHNCQVISLRTQLRTHLEDLCWTELDAKATALTSFLIYEYLSRRCGFLRIIEGSSPQLHDSSPV